MADTCKACGEACQPDNAFVRGDDGPYHGTCLPHRPQASLAEVLLDQAYHDRCMLRHAAAHTFDAHDGHRFGRCSACGHTWIETADLCNQKVNARG